MCGKTVSKSVGMNVFLDTRSFGRFLTRVPNRFRIDRPITAMVAVAWKQPSTGLAVVEAPLCAECLEELWAEHDIAIFAPLAATDVNNHPLTVDDSGFQVGELAVPGARCGERW